MKAYILTLFILNIIAWIGLLIKIYKQEKDYKEWQIMRRNYRAIKELEFRRLYV